MMYFETKAEAFEYGLRRGLEGEREAIVRLVEELRDKWSHATCSAMAVCNEILGEIRKRGSNDNGDNANQR